MGKPSSATSLVVLALLSCLAARNVEAQGSSWMKPAQKGHQGTGTYPGQPAPQPYPGQTNTKPVPKPYPGQPAPQPYPGQPAPQPYPGQPAPQPYPGQTNIKPVPNPYPGQPAPQPYPGQTNIKPAPQPYPGQPAPQPYPGQTNIKPVPKPYPGQPAPQPYPGQPAPQPYPGQTNIKPVPNPYPGQPAPQPYPGQTNIKPAPQPYPGQTNIKPVPNPYPGQPAPRPYPGQTNIKPVPKPYPGQPAPQPYPGQTNIKPVPNPYPGQPAPRPYPGQTNIKPVPNPYPGQPAPQPYPGQTNIKPPTQQGPVIHPPQNQVYYDQSRQEPQISPPQTPHRTSPLVPKDPNDVSCEVNRNVRIPCGGPQISAAGCEAINCCFDGQQCFFGKAVTIQCTRDAQFIVVVARDATLPNIDLESISMLGGGQGCTHVDSNSEFVIYQFPVTGCGSMIWEEPGIIAYENRMSSKFEMLTGERGVITRDSQFELIFQCRFIGTSVETLVVEVLPLQEPPLPVAALGPIRVGMRLANGQCLSKGCNEVDVAYNSYYLEGDYPVTTVLRNRVYVEVQLLEKTDPNLVLTLGHCWTTTSPNPHSLPQWDILIDGCPYRDDRYLSSLVPVGISSGLEFPSHYRRFIFKMFTFVDANTLTPMRELVYIHCSTTVCSASSGNCEPSCFRKKRDAEATYQARSQQKIVVSSGALNMVAPPETSKE